MNDLLNLCSGEFPENMKSLVDHKQDVSRDDLEAELLDLCSGKFGTQPDFPSQSLNSCSGNFSKNTQDSMDSMRAASFTQTDKNKVPLSNSAESLNTQDMTRKGKKTFK